MANWAFDKDKFLAVFPEFGNTSDAQFDFYVAEAQCYELERYGITEPKLTVMYFKLIAFLIALAQRGANGISGEITSASEGSVSVGSKGMSRMSGSFFNQIPAYGGNFWQMMRPYLTPRYISGC